jgi:hypothetical protein
VTKERINQELRTLQQQHEQQVANINALVGAIQVLKKLLEEMEEEGNVQQENKN